MAHFPGGRGSTFRFVMIPGNEPTGDGRYVGITTVTAAQWRALLHVMDRDDLADDDDLSTMIGRFMRAARGQPGCCTTGPGAHTAEEIEAACSAARVPVAIVGNGELLPQFEQLRSRDVFVPQPGAGFVRPRAPFRVPRDRATARSNPAPASARSRRDGMARLAPARTRRGVKLRRTPARRRAGARLHRVLVGSVRDGVARRDGRRRHQGRVGAAARRHPLQRRRPPGSATRSTSRSRRCSTRPTCRSAGSPSTSRRKPGAISRGG